MWSGFRRGSKEQNSSQDYLYAVDSNVMPLHEMARRLSVTSQSDALFGYLFLSLEAETGFYLQRVTRFRLYHYTNSDGSSMPGCA